MSRRSSFWGSRCLPPLIIREARASNIGGQSSSNLRILCIRKRRPRTCCAASGSTSRRAPPSGLPRGTPSRPPGPEPPPMARSVRSVGGRAPGRRAGGRPGRGRASGRAGRGRTGGTDRTPAARLAETWPGPRVELAARNLAARWGRRLGPADDQRSALRPCPSGGTAAPHVRRAHAPVRTRSSTSAAARTCARSCPNHRCSCRTMSTSIGGSTCSSARARCDSSSSRR